MERILPHSFSNLHFDFLASAMSIGTLASKTKSVFATGVNYFPVTAFGDRIIKWACTGDFHITGEHVSTMTQEVVNRTGAALLEKTAYSAILLNQQDGALIRSLRLITSFALSLTASRSLRHQDLKKQDLTDAGVGLCLAASREIVQLTCSEEVALGYSLLSNALVFALIEKMKFSGNPPMMKYKMISALFFRATLDISSIRSNSVIPSMVHHTLFNLSRCLP